MPNETAVTTDISKDQFVSIYLGVIGVVGFLIIGVGVAMGWGFYAYLVGGILAVAGFGGLIGKRSQGGFGESPCPGCGAPLKFQFTKVERTMQCEACRAWSEGTDTMRLVPDDRVASYPVFTTPMPADGVAWPLNSSGGIACPVCDATSSGFLKIEGSDALGLAASMASPVSVRRVHSVEAPICPEHDDGAALFVSGSTLSLGFRSRAYQLRFDTLNGASSA